MTVGTQTELCKDAHRKLRRIGTREDREIQTNRWIQGLRTSDQEPEPESRMIGMNMSKYKTEKSETNLDQYCNMEVCLAFSRGCLALQDAIQYNRRAEIHFHSARFLSFSRIIF